MGTLTKAVQQQQWELAAYCLLIAVTRVADKVPREGLAELLRLLAEGARDPSR
jgi:hypothetical protein